MGEGWFLLQLPSPLCNRQALEGTGTGTLHLMLMFAVAFVAGAEMTSRSDLLTSAADLEAATTERVIGVASSFWSALPQATKEITVEVGTKLVFKWKGGHDVVITGKDVWDTCVSTWLLNRGLTVHRPTVAPTELALCRSPGEPRHSRSIAGLPLTVSPEPSPWTGPHCGQ